MALYLGSDKVCPTLVSGNTSNITLYAWEQSEGRNPVYFYSKSTDLHVGDTVLCYFNDYSTDTPLPYATVTNIVSTYATIYIPTKDMTMDEFRRDSSADLTI